MLQNVTAIASAVEGNVHLLLKIAAVRVYKKWSGRDPPSSL
jgi:hypothetical protein